MDLRKLKTLIDLVSESNVSELEITEADGKVRIVKQSATQVVAMPAPVYAAPPAAAAAPAAAAPAAAPAAEAISGQVIKSPMVGTFYRASSPGAKAIADVGTQVKKGQAVCIIEAMKIMNEIESEFDGTVSKVLVENGQAVEYGQPLFIIE
ncbi:acetyl-CoA carboxylase biotin carboxyl carrier protein [Sphaerotilus uruguayifluvii]|uniref:Biotin carboxyl carrier protein of acetyl-CoA carboxylase n=1 Tax=Sphaerotilus uruguayifluvii TaxID=2735897 RepID=A0ABX2G215_9BURK|nr:acetyl-CoA carboxylase biotin carboxyl carrier protein [Leptothrix sp. C29]NRT56340.1 acetyl-CoA carboxylase biotin carboxyl carrier protein [Leptothrix sp. C29]